MGNILSEQKNIKGERGKFLKKRKLCMRNLMKEPKQPRLVILQLAIFSIYLFCICD